MNNKIKSISLTLVTKSGRTHKALFDVIYKSSSWLNQHNLSPVKTLYIRIEKNNSEVKQATFDSVPKAISWLNLNDSDKGVI